MENETETVAMFSANGLIAAVAREQMPIRLAFAGHDYGRMEAVLARLLTWAAKCNEELDRRRERAMAADDDYRAMNDRYAEAAVRD